jgi:hypothetical protein
VPIIIRRPTTKPSRVAPRTKHFDAAVKKLAPVFAEIWEEGTSAAQGSDATPLFAPDGARFESISFQRIRVQG